jgi:glycosyltransferase involved in cell wall biosynthesis
MPVHDPEPLHLVHAFESVLAQVHQRWELCVADDASTRPEVASVLAQFTDRDPRIRLVRLDRNQNIAAATNAALSLATGEFVAFLDHDDELAPLALLSVAEFLVNHPDTDVLYTDEATIAPDGRVLFTDRKTDWQPESFLAHMYTGHLTVVRRTLLQSLSNLRPGYDGAQDYDLMLRLMARTDRIRHLPEVLYRWRAAPSSTAGNPDAKPGAEIAAGKALQDHVERIGLRARVQPGDLTFTYRLDFDPPNKLPSVAVLARNARDHDRLLTSIRRLRDRSKDVLLSLWILDSEGTWASTPRVTDDGIRVVAEPTEALLAADLVLLIDGYLDAGDNDWLADMAAHLRLIPGGVIGPVASASARRPTIERDAFWNRLVRNGRPDARCLLVRAADLASSSLPPDGEEILERLQSAGGHFLIYPSRCAIVGGGSSSQRASVVGDQFCT